MAYNNILWLCDTYEIANAYNANNDVAINPYSILTSFTRQQTIPMTTMQDDNPLRTRHREKGLHRYCNFDVIG